VLLRDLPLPLLLLVDLLMPQVDGWEFIEAVRADERTRDVPVVVMSSSISIQRIPDRVTFLQKPFKLQRLLATIRQAHATL
jgi:CheY-like chemotaxis protein